ncbi:hypothetical protein [Bacillus glycinifermentans]|uniref:Lipoprotein n=1 Tax=Bacillus glycinifermentans TaxID=1664069 RepID=A0ABU6H1J0_9BACI|nr:hypothetical protein [Bacillus glycinifermentans]MEC0484850.1 hypothetical protein [Bacillus glycinifermentans]MEC0495967.1 hypothetical protein [Bacillus glycinifermentans]MEC0539086.1 hypothetical protein [Bacillus glycinifermentans]UOY89753.1 hypothetical protein MW696_05860 [Bacillus glycinifermentans]
MEEFTIKKVFLSFLFVICISILLAGCNGGDKKSDWADGLEKTQKIEVISPGESEPASNITDQQDIADFVQALKLDEWEVTEVPSNAVKGKEFKMYQEETDTISDSNKDKKDLKEIGNITTYSNASYIDFNLKNVKFSFKIPEDAFKYLSEYQ